MMGFFFFRQQNFSCAFTFSKIYDKLTAKESPILLDRMDGTIMLQKNQLYTAAVSGFTSEGLGVCHVEGCAVFVPNAVQAEVYSLRIVHVGRTSAYGKIEAILSPSPHRIPRRCPYAKLCGGCTFWHMDYEAELAIKRQRVYDALTRIGGVELSMDELPILGAETTDGYRNKVQFPVALVKGRAEAGFFQAKSHDLVPIDRCLIQPACAGIVRETVMAFVRRHRISCYDEATHTGLLRHIYVRVGSVTGQVLVCLVINGSSLPKSRLLVDELRQRVAGLTSVVLNVNKKRGNTILGDEMIPLYGDGTIVDQLCGLNFRLSARSFYQVNHAQAQRLYGIALDFAGITPTDTALDLYCGAGTITLCLARQAGQVIGVEVVDAAIADAKDNARANGVENVRFLCADAGHAAQQLAQEGIRPNVIVVDPPRKGLSLEVIDAIARMSPDRLVYVSCDPATAARDTKALTERGFAFQKASAVDMFPRCSHVETVVLMSRVEK